MHILILADPIDNQKAGVHTYTKNLILELLEQTNTLTNAHIKKTDFTFIHERENPFFDALQKKYSNFSHIIIHRRKIPGYNSLRKFILIPRVVRKIKPGIVLEPCHIGPFNLPKNIKRAVTIHDLTPILFPKFHIKKSTIIHRLLLKKALKNADVIITASEQNKKDILSYCRTKAKIKVIPLGIPKSKNHPREGIFQKNKILQISNPEHQNHPRGRLFQQNKILHPPYILYLGTIEPRKNLEILIDAFIELKKEEKIPHNLVIAGETGWKAKKIIQKAKNTPGVILPGYVNETEKQKLYQGASVFVYPSLYEGFGLPPMEAMQYGTPLICSTGGALKEVYKNRASLFDPSDKKHLKKLLIRHLNKKKKKIQNSIPSFEKTAKETLKALSKTISTQPIPAANIRQNKR